MLVILSCSLSGGIVAFFGSSCTTQLNSESKKRVLLGKALGFDMIFPGVGGNVAGFVGTTVVF